MNFDQSLKDKQMDYGFSLLEVLIAISLITLTSMGLLKQHVHINFQYRYIAYETQHLIERDNKTELP